MLASEGGAESPLPFAEVQLKDAEGKTSIPDGAIVVEWGKKRWRALLEVKTGTAELTEEQVSRYVDLARLHGFDAVVTLSNEITPSAEESPVKVHGRSSGGWTCGTSPGGG